jgi:surfactin synthase thioesterase subunit
LIDKKHFGEIIKDAIKNMTDPIATIKQNISLFGISLGGMM